MSHTPRERYEVGQLLPGTSLVVIGTRSGAPPRQPASAKQLQSEARRALEDIIPLVELIAKGELLADKVIDKMIVQMRPDHGDQLKAASMLGKWAGVEIPEDLGGQRLIVHISGGVNIGAAPSEAPAVRQAPPVAFVEGLGQVDG